MMNMNKETMVTVMYKGLSVDTTHENVLKAISTFKEMSSKKRKQLLRHIQCCIEEARSCLSSISEQDRQNLCDDIVLVVACEHFMEHLYPSC